MKLSNGLTVLQEKSGPSQGQLSASRVLPLILGITLIGGWTFWFLGVVGVVPAIAWTTIEPGMTWLGITFLGAVLPLIMNYWQKGRNGNGSVS